MSVIDNLTNWYIRFNRKRLKGSAGLGVQDTTAAMNTLFQVLFTLVRALAPFTPFIAEHIYGLLKPHLDDDALKEFPDSRSVHFLSFPTVEEALFDETIERQVSVMQKVIQLGRTIRERCSLALKTPLHTIVAVADPHVLDDVKSLSSYIREELNVRNIVLTSDEAEHNILLEAKVDWPTLGKKLKKNVQVVRKALPSLTQAELRQFVAEKKIVVEGIELVDTDLTIVRVLGERAANASENGPKWEPAFDDDMVVLLDAASYPELANEGFVREIINRVQRLRKKAGLAPVDVVRMQYSIIANPENVDIDGLVKAQDSAFVTALRGSLETVPEKGADDQLILEEEQAIGDLTLMLRLLKT